MFRPLRPALGRFILCTGLGLSLIECRSTGPAAPPEAEAPSAPEAKAAEDAPPAPEPAAAREPARDEDEDEEGSAGVEIALEEQRITFDSAGRQTRTFKQIYRVVDPLAVEYWGSIAAEWSPWHERRPVLRARVKGADGRTYELDPKTVSESPAVEYSPDIFSDRRSLRAPLPGVAVGSEVELEVVTSEEEPFFPGGGGGGYFEFGSSAPVVRSRLVLDAPAGLEVRFARRGAAPEPKITAEGGRRVITFEAGALPRLEDGEPYSPFDQPTGSEVVFGVGPTWAELARRYGEIVERQLAGADVERWVEGAVRGERAREKVIARLMARLHERIRYTGLELADAAIIPRRPEETLSRGYGDCKDKSTLLVAMLRAAGIEAHVALVESGFGTDVVESVPSPTPFNHAIVYVPGPPALWIDATFEDGRLGELPLSVQGHLALVARPDTRGLVRIPATSSADNTYVETREVFLSNYGPGRFVEESEGRGSMEHDLRGRLARVKDAELKKLFRSYAASNYLAEGVAKVERFGAASLDDPFRIRLTFEKARRGTTDPTESAVFLTASGVLGWVPSYLMRDDPEPKPGEPPPKRRKRERRNDLALGQPYSAELRYRVVPPPGFALRNLPEDQALELGPARFTERYVKSAGGELSAIFRFDTGRARYSPADVRAFLDALPKLEERLNRLVVFDHEPTRLASLGQVKEALALHRKVIAAEPKDAIHRARFANTLLAAGFGDAARKEARAAVSLDPRCWYAEFTLGWVLGHDAFGRLDGPGADHRGAIEAYRKAKALDPKDVQTRRNLAVELEYGAQGRRYGPGAHVDEAIAEYEALRRDLKDDGFDSGLMVLLMRSGRAAELKTFVKDRPKSPLRNKALVFSTALLDGRAAMRRAIDGLGLDAASRQTLISAAVGDLMNAREYGLAREVAEDALPGAPNIVHEETRLAMIKKLRKHEAASEDAKTPDALVLRWIAELLSNGSRTELAAISARYSSAALLEETRRAASRGSEVTALLVPSAIVGSGGVPETLDAGLVADLGTSLMQPRVDGSEKVGYRVALQQPETEERETFFVVREGGAYKIRASGANTSSLGAQALALGERGDWAGARQWLDWAREAATSASGDDPLRGEPFTRLWTRGEDATPERTRVAAAALMALGSGTADAAVPALKSARSSATGEPRAAIDLALLYASVMREQHKDTVEVGHRLLEEFPRSEIAFAFTANALLRLGRHDELLAKVRARLAVEPGDVMAIGWESRVASKRGDFSAEVEAQRRIIALGKATSSTYNNLAWSALFAGTSLEEATEYAVRAVSMSKGQDLASIHTLATIYAERGKTAEASSLVKRLIDARHGEPKPYEWYIIGRIAETYELLDVAKSAYERVGQKENEPESTGVLARRRLDALARARTAKR